MIRTLWADADGIEQAQWVAFILTTAFIVAGIVFGWLGQIWFVSVLSIQASLGTGAGLVISANARRKVGESADPT